MKSYFVLPAVVFGFFLPSTVFAAADKPLTQYTLEELMNTRVYSAAKSEKPLSETPAAVFVIHAEDIRRSPAQKIPELLRMAPGVQVARSGSNSWAISIRGFNDNLANKLLVLIDGRSVYTPLFGGVYWDVQDLLLEDIDRIEIIRGPGGSLWGSNAVNGVINIITKHSRETQGVLVRGGGGSETYGDAAVRAGGKAGEDVTYRVYGKYFNQDNFRFGNDAWYQWRTGFRSDWDNDDTNAFTFQGDAYYGSADLRNFGNFAEAPFQRVINEDQEIAGGNLLGRWRHDFSETSEGSLQTYFDTTKRTQSQIGEDRYTWDIEWDHRFMIGERHEAVYGLGYRASHDRTEGSFNTSFSPQERTLHLFQAFVQDTFAVIPDKLWLTGGIKGEHNSYTAFEFQPTARMLWQPAPDHSIWASYSRAVRIPSRVESDIMLQSWVVPNTFLARIHSDSTSQSEVMNAYELGYRTQIHPRLFLDIATFYNHYHGLRNSRFGSAYMENGRLILPIYFDDQASANTYGGELAATATLTEWWEWYTAYSLFHMQLESHQDPINAISTSEGKSPKHQIFMQSRMDLPGSLELDTSLRYVDHLNALGAGAYWEMDMRLGWQMTPNVEVSLIGQNLFHNYHREFSSSGAAFERAFFAKAVLQFD